MTSYEELSPEMRAQVDALMGTLDYALKRDCLTQGYVRDYLREHISNCVITCVGISKEKPRTTPIKKRHGNYYY